MSLIFGRDKGDSSGSNSNTEQTIGSSSLQQAIERNRLKLLQKGSPSLGSGPDNDNLTNPKPSVRSSIPLEEKLKQLRVDPSLNLVIPPPKPMPSPPPLTSAKSPFMDKITNPETILNPNLRLDSISSVKSKWDYVKSNIFNYFLKGLWIFSIVLLLRLIFADRGVLEYSFRRKKVQEKLEILDKQVQINKKITKEITRIQKDITFQKSLVRNHLGFIADDEFIVVLPEPKTNSNF